MRILLATWVASWGLFAFAFDVQPTRPDPALTPGELCTRQDPDFDRLRYEAKIVYCRRNVSSATKAAIYDLYNIPVNKRRNYTIDHFIPLSIGGSNNPANLWPEHKKIKELRPNLELEVFLDLKEGRATQEEVVRRITEEKMNPPVRLDEVEYYY